MIKGILFDLDGVIVDTLHYHYLAWKHMFETYGGTVREHTVLLHEGRSSHEILPLLMEESGVAIPPQQQGKLIEEKRAYYRSIAHVEPYPNAFAVIAALKERGFKLALVTACALENMRHSLNGAQRSLFDFIVTGGEVARAKPYPDSYLAAAENLGLGAGACLVVENAPLGIEAAKNAGMLCAAIQTTLGKEYLARADYILQNIEMLLELPMLKK